MLLVTTILVHSSTTVHAMEDNGDGSSNIPHKGPTNTVKTDEPLNMFFKESLEKRGFAIKTQRTVIIPVALIVDSDIEDMPHNKATEFLPEVETFKSADLYVEHYAQLQAYENMSLEDKQNVKIYDCAIMTWDEELSRLSFAGLYSILPPDSEGWSESRFILRQQYRNKGLGEEVKNAIYNNIVKDLIGKTVKLIKYETDNKSSNARYEGIPIPMTKAYLEDSKVVFRGLQGWVHEDNKASIRLNQKCGWIECGFKEEIDLKGHMKKHYLYRSPPLL